MTNNDLELLKLAAEAAGYVFVSHTGYDEEDDVYITKTWARKTNKLVSWNPLEDDGDAFRLAVKLNISSLYYTDDDWTSCNEDGYAATRRTIVRAAAEIGRAMNDSSSE